MINTELLVNEARQIGVELDEMAVDRFEITAQRLLRWNQHVNLTAITEPDEIVTKHFVDSLTPLKYIDLPRRAKVIDVGCGAGFPGLPILYARPDLEFTFLDSVRKKLGFIKEILRYNGLFGETCHERAEILGRDKAHRESYDAAFTRAVAPLNVLAEYCLPLVRVGGIYVSLKGADDEIALGRKAIETLGGKIEQVVPLSLPNGDKRNIIVVRKVSQCPTKYPRKSKKIDTKPL